MCECSESVGGRPVVQERMVKDKLYVYSRRFCLSTMEMVDMYDRYSGEEHWNDIGLLKDKVLTEQMRESLQSAKNKKSAEEKRLSDEMAKRKSRAPVSSRTKMDRPTAFIVKEVIPQYKTAINSEQAQLQHPLCESEIIDVMRDEFALISRKSQVRITKEFARRLGMDLVSRKAAVA